jgi:predicted phage-related endonuclease
MNRFTIIDCEQRSQEWFAARAGRLTGSAAADMMRKTKSGDWAASRKHLRMRLALERITGQPQERAFTTAAVERGRELEGMAASRYEAETGYILEPLGFLSMGPIMAGCSLDSFIHGRRGLVEIKCPESATHYEYLKTREIPPDYRWQCIHNLWVTGAEIADFISFDDRFPDDLQYLCVSLQRKEREIEAYEAEVSKFLAEVAVEVNEINKLRKAA